MNKLKIVELIPYLSIGGAEVLVDSLAKSFPSDKCEVIVLSMRDFVHDRFKDSINKDYKFISLGKKPGINIGFGKRLKKCIDELDPDIIHVHLNCVNYAARYLTKCRAKIFFTLHSLPNKDNYFLFRQFIKPYIKKGRIIPIGISNEISLLTKKVYGVDNVITINNGISLKDVNLNEDRIYDFINVGRFIDVKNQLALVKAFSEVNKIHKTAKMVIVGYGEKEEEIRSLITSLNLENNITLISDGKNPYQYLLKSKTFILPSIYEGSPLSLLEAYECGLAVIASNVGGIPDVLKDNANGFLLSNDNIDLINKMNYMLENPNKVKEFASNNLVDIKKFDIKKIAMEYYKVFINETK